ncbi:MAG: hypothetical protein PHX10_09010 [Gallionellaceae bacterium]|nr:hypothetical protein [Gallionellaceae bacterium]
MAAAGGNEAGAGSICRAGRCRYAAVVLVAAGLLAWWFAAGKGEDAPPVAERASALLPGVEHPATVGAAPMAATGPDAKPLPTIDVMADKLARRLEKEPADGEGWALLARTYLELGDAARADAAYAKALALRPDDRFMQADYQAARKALLPSAR